MTPTDRDSEWTNANAERERASTEAGSGRRRALYGIAVAVAVLGAAVLAAVAFGPDSKATSGTNATTDTAEASAETQQTAFALFDEFHATLIVTPAAAGTNTVDLFLATHDGSGAPEVSEVTVAAALPSAGVSPTVYPAEPVADSPGAYRVTLPLTEPGDWELTVSAVSAASGAVAETTVVPIGAR